MVINRRPSETDLSLLRNVPALKHCDDKELARVSALVDEVEVPAGTVLAREGAIGREAFVIIEGWAAVTVRGEPLAALGPGQFVGELAMLDLGPRTATVVAKSKMRVLVIGRHAFGSFVSEPGVSKGLTDTLVERLRRADEELTRRADSAGKEAVVVDNN